MIDPRTGEVIPNRTARPSNGFYTKKKREFREGKLCAYCEVAPATQVDHKIPLRRGGVFYDESNWAPCCGPCNRAKGSLTAEEFLGQISRSYELETDNRTMGCE